MKISIEGIEFKQNDDFIASNDELITAQEEGKAGRGRECEAQRQKRDVQLSDKEKEKKIERKKT